MINIVLGDRSRAGEMLLLLKDAANWMQSNGIQQWTPDQFHEADVISYFEDREVYQVLKEEELMGFFTLQFSDPQYWGSLNDDSYAYLHRLTVAMPYRGTGLGKRMIDKAAVAANTKGCKGLRLDTVANNTRLNGYYQSLGFQYMGTNDMGGGRLVNLYERK